MKKTILQFALFLLAVLLPTGCSSDEEDELEIADELLNQTTCEFNIDFIDHRYKTQPELSKNGTWTIMTIQGIITNIDFGENPSPTPPPSPETFLNEFVELTEDVTFIPGALKDNTISYSQYYKDIPVVYLGFVDDPVGYTFIYLKEKTLKGIGGGFLPINDLDVMPRYDERKLQAIAMSCIKNQLSDRYTDITFKERRLIIAACPYKDWYEPRLAYQCYAICTNIEGTTTGVNCFIDARTGKLLSLGINI